MSATKGAVGVRGISNGWRQANTLPSSCWASRSYRSQAAEAKVEPAEELDNVEDHRPVPGPGPSTLAYIPHSSFANLVPRLPTTHDFEFPPKPLYPRPEHIEAEEEVELSISRNGSFKQRYKDLKESTHSLSHALDRKRKVEVTERISQRVSEFTDKSLREFYVALLEIGREEGLESLKIEAPKVATPVRLGYKKRKEILAAIEKRLHLEEPIGRDLEEEASEPLSKRLASLSASAPPAGPDDAAPSSIPVGKVLNAEPILNNGEAISRLDPRQVASAAQRVPIRTRILARLAKIGSECSEVETTGVPLGLLSGIEWQALIDDFTANDNARGAEVAVAIMQQHGTRPSEKQSLAFLELDARRGRTHEIIRVIHNLSESGQPIPLTHHELLLKAHLVASPSHPQNAINYLRSLEISGSPLPQSSYLIVLDHLLNPSPRHATNSRTHAMAWDLFAHLRLVAHPTPSMQMYATMINACANPSNPQPERARDLWIEMTQEGDHASPGRQEYEALIRALGSTKAGYLEAVNYLREMLAKHREVATVPFAEGPGEVDRATALASKYIPTRSTFVALLEGTKRAGDVNRARWILAEVLRLARARGEAGMDEAPEEELMAGVFMTYAAWQPAITRGAVKLQAANPETLKQDEAISQEEERVVQAELPLQAADTTVEGSQDEVPQRSEGSESLGVSLPSLSSPHGGPQTRTDAIREANSLFQRIIEDQSRAAGAKDDSSLAARPFQNVKVTPRLVNTFLSIHFAHANLSDSRQAWDSAWGVVESRTRARPNGWSYLLALGRCATAKGVARPEALAWATDLWQHYIGFSKRASASIETAAREAGQDPMRARWLAGLGPRQVEKTWSAMIRAAALCDNVPMALQLLDEFRTTYPPSDILKGYEPTFPTSFSVRMTNPSETAEPDVPPHLLFHDIDIVHQRLVRQGDLSNIGKVKWTCIAYEKALERRRAWRLRNAGEWRVRASAAREGAVASRHVLSTTS